MIYLNLLLLQHAAENCPGCFWNWAGWMLLSAILGLGLGYWLWGNFKKLNQDKERIINDLKNKHSVIEKNHIQTKYQLVEFEKDNKGLKAELTEVQSNLLALGQKYSTLKQQKVNPTTIVENIEKTPQVPLVPSEEKRSIENQQEEIEKQVVESSTQTIKGAKVPSINFSNHFKVNNLQIIEGIGPKLESILNKAEILNWSDLASISLQKLRDIIHDAGPRFRIHDPSNWPQQARLAKAQEWAQLIHLQKIIFAKKTDVYSTNELSKVEILLAKKFGYPEIKGNSLQIIEGIGPKIEQLLKDNNIETWKDIATCSFDKIQKIINNAGEQFNLTNPNSWIAQARLAVENNWEQLRAYQDKLNSKK